MIVSVAIGVFVASAVYLLLQRGIVRITLGVILLANAVNLTLLASGGLARRGAPIAGEAGPAADPLPQAFVLTAIVISLGVTAFALGMALHAYDLFGDDDTEDEP